MDRAIYILLAGIFPNLKDILFNMFNVVLLTVVLTLLIYKPVKKGMQKRRDAALKTANENQALSLKIESIKEKQLEAAKKARDETSAMQKQVLQTAEKSADGIIEEAQALARTIIEDAKSESVRIKENLQEEVRAEIAQVSKEVAKNILAREITQADNDELILKSIKSWQENE